MKRYVFLILSPLTAMAAEPQLAPPTDAELVAIMEQAAKQAPVTSVVAANSVQPEALTEKTPVRRPADIRTSRDEISALVDEVDRLQSEVVLTKRAALATEEPQRKPSIGVKTVYSYQEGKLYEVHAAVDRITDIELQPGEQLSSAPVAGDTVRWKVAVVTSGTKKGDTTHVILKSLEEGLETNLLLTTNRRTYHLRCLSGGAHMPAVSWNYPDDELEALNAQIARKKDEQPVGVSPADLRFDYHVSDRKFSWKPIRVFDDGRKTWLQMPKNIANAEAPVLFILDEDEEPVLVNYRVQGDFYVVDRLFDRAQLRVGGEQYINIESSRYSPSFWDRIF